MVGGFFPSSLTQPAHALRLLAMHSRCRMEVLMRPHRSHRHNSASLQRFPPTDLMLSDGSQTFRGSSLAVMEALSSTSVQTRPLLGVWHDTAPPPTTALARRRRRITSRVPRTRWVCWADCSPSPMLRSSQRHISNGSFHNCSTTTGVSPSRTRRLDESCSSSSGASSSKRQIDRGVSKLLMGCGRTSWYVVMHDRCHCVMVKLRLIPLVFFCGHVHGVDVCLLYMFRVRARLKSVELVNVFRFFLL